MKKILLLLTLFIFNISVHAASVDINKADAKTISESIKGIGMKKAQAIVNYRKKHGSFKSLDDLMDVKGIGEKTIKKIGSQTGLSKSKGKKTTETKKVKKKTTEKKSTQKTTKTKKSKDKK